MNMMFNIQPFQIKKIYNSFVTSKNKDNIHMVLEPLQAIIQLSLLSILPIGTKLAIHENILYLQNPSILQPINRWYNVDKKDDLYFLFQVIKRFIKWYNPKSDITPISEDFYYLLIKMAINGFDNLIKTYQTSNSTSIIQALNMYKSLLASNDTYDVIVANDDKIDIDEIFINIIKQYDKNLINVLYNMFILINNEETTDNIYNYIDGLNLIMDKNNKLIQNWIRVNLVV
jgi:hypothetical protein